MNRYKKIKISSGDRVFYSIINVITLLIFLIVLYPLVYVVSASFSSSQAVSSGQVFLFPVDFSLEGYKAVFQNKDIGGAYLNTIFYTVFGTLINVAVTLMAAYPLSRADLKGRGILSFVFTFTMLFGGGMIPTYLVIKNLQMINTIWAILLPGAISVYNTIVTRSFIESGIPGDLLEAAKMDGCSDVQYFFSILLPLSKAVIAVITVFYAVGHWNSYFSAFLYLNNRELYPLQMILKEILITNQISADMLMSEEMILARQGLAELLKYSLIIVATIPVLCVYPFAQKYFVKGVMVGSVKG